MVGGLHVARHEPKIMVEAISMEVAMAGLYGVVVDAAVNNGLFKVWQLFEGQKWRHSTQTPVESGAFLLTMDVLPLYTSIPHKGSITATASVLNTNNCQFPDAILQLIHFIFDHNVFTFDNHFFTQKHRTPMGTRFAPQYVNIFMHKFEQDFFAAQDLQPMLYTKYNDDIVFLWTQSKESLKQLHSDINKFHLTIRLTTDHSSNSISFFNTRISIKDGHLSTSLYYKPTDNLMKLHFSSFHPKHTKEAIPYGQALCIHRICSGEEERNRHLNVLKDALKGTGYEAQLVNCQFRCATMKNRNDLLRRQTQDKTNGVPFVIQYFPRAEKLRHTFVYSKLPRLQDNIDHNATKPCHGNLCKICQIIDIDTTITHGNTTHHIQDKYSSSLANCLFHTLQTGMPQGMVFGKSMQTLRQQMNGHHATIARQECSLPVGEHFSGRGHSASDLRPQPCWVFTILPDLPLTEDE
eukprot:g40394.t1